MRHSTASVSGFTPGGRGVGTPGLIGSLWPDEAVVGGAVGVVCGRAGGAVVEGSTLVVSCGAPVFKGGRAVAERVVSVAVDGRPVVAATPAGTSLAGLLAGCG